MLPASLLLPYSLFPSPAHCLLHPAFHFSADLRCKWSCLWLCLCSCHHCADNDNDNDEADLAPHSTHSHTLVLLPCCAGCEFSFQLCKYDKWVEQSDTPPHMQGGGGEKEWERRKCTASRHFVRQWENAGWKPQQFVAAVRWLRHTHIHTGRHTHIHRQCLHTHVTWLPGAEFCNLCIIIMIIVIAPTPRHTHTCTHTLPHTPPTHAHVRMCVHVLPLGPGRCRLTKNEKEMLAKMRQKKMKKKIIKKTENAYNINTL